MSKEKKITQMFRLSLGETGDSPPTGHVHHLAFTSLTLLCFFFVTPEI